MRQDFHLRSSAFRHEREERWRELEALLEKAARGGLEKLDADELYRLPALYRATVSSLSVARAISLDANLVAYLESLAARAYLEVYGAKRSVGGTLATFFRRRFPAAVRSLAAAVALAAALLGGGTVAGLLLVADDPERYYSLMPEQMAQGRSPASSRDELAAVLVDDGGGGSDSLAAFASFLFSHNSRVGMLCFALGPAAGVPVLLLLFHNGLLLGALAAVYQRQGLGLEFWGWILPHGVTELLAVCLCGAAGLALGGAVVFPGRHGRLENLAREGRRAAVVVLGSIALFAVAGLIEGFFRQLVTGPVPRYALAAGSAVFWALYFGTSGRRAAAEDDGAGPTGAGW